MSEKNLKEKAKQLMLSGKIEEYILQLKTIALNAG
jgi:hypothetical protein